MRGTLGFCARGWRAFADFFHNACGRHSRYGRYNLNPASGSFDFLTANNFVQRPVSSLDKHIGKELRYYV